MRSKFNLFFATGELFFDGHADRKNYFGFIMFQFFVVNLFDIETLFVRNADSIDIASNETFGRQRKK